MRKFRLPGVLTQEHATKSDHQEHGSSKFETDRKSDKRDERDNERE